MTEAESVRQDRMTGGPCTAEDSALPSGATADFEAAYRSLWPQVARLAHVVAGSQAVGEELAQEAFLGLLRRGSSVQSPAADLRRSVINLALTARRRQGYERTYITAAREAVIPPPEVDETWAALVKLPPRQRAVLALRYYEDLSEAEIADVLSCRRGTVKSLSARALKRLRQELDT